MRYAEEFRRLYDDERRLRRAAEEAAGGLAESYSATVRSLAAALELRHDETAGHAARVTRLAVRLAERLAPELAADPQFEYGCLLHDIGKIGVPDATLLKPSWLDDEERMVMRSHARLGESVVGAVPHLGGVALQVVAAHHERWDGTGYPRGLAADAIPLAARIFAVADAFDAMTNDRPYRRALPVEAALAELEAHAGSQFDPRAAREFVALVSELDTAA